MHSPSLPTQPKARARRAAAPAISPYDVSILFVEWARARTEVPKTASGWTSFDRLHRDFSEYLDLLRETESDAIPGCTREQFKQLMLARRWRNRPQPVRALGGATASMANCWNVHLIPAGRQ